MTQSKFSRNLSLYRLRTLFLFAFVAFSAGSLFSQTVSAVEQGIISLQAYDGNGIGQVNLANGNLVLNIPLISYKERGKLPPYTLSLTSNNKNWALVYNPPSEGGCYYGCYQWVATGQGVSLSEATTLTQNSNTSCIFSTLDNFYGAPCYTDDGSGLGHGFYYTNFSVVDGTGATHVDPDGLSPVLDSSGLLMTYIRSNGINYSNILDSKGNTYSSWCTSNNQQYYGCIQGYYTVTDTDGNTMTYNLPYDPSGATSEIQYAPTITDSIGRTIPRFTLTDQIGGSDSTGSPGSQWCVTKNYPSLANQSEPITICWEIYQGQSNFSVLSPNPDVPVLNGLVIFTGISSVTIPDGLQWTFTYDSWGNLHSVTTPTGATETYTWSQVTQGWPGDPGLGFPPLEVAVTQRVLTVSGLSSTWTYQYQNDTTGGVVTVSDPICNPSNQSACDHSVHTFGFNHQYETDVKYYDYNNTLLKTVDTTYAYPNQFTIPLNVSSGDTLEIPANNGVTVKSVKTTWAASGSVSMVCTVYDQDTDTTCSNPAPSGASTYSDSAPTFTDTDVDNRLTDAHVGFSNNLGTFPVVRGILKYKFEYDFGSGSPGSLIRQIANTYKWEQTPSYLSANLLDLVYQSTVSNNSGAMAAQTTYGYDESNGSPQGVFGNQTSVTRANNNGASPTTHTVYNTYGMPTSTIDGNGYTDSTISYDETGLYPHSICRATTGSVTHCDQYNYDSSTSLLNSHTDEDNVTTTYSYNDPLLRVTQVQVAPSRGQAVASTTYTYPNPTTVITAEDQSTIGDGAIQKTTYYDQLLRPVETELTSDPAGTDYTYTNYDGLGRVQSVTNPYRSTSDPTYNMTSYTYDALNRKLSESDILGTKEQLCYDGGPSSCLLIAPSQCSGSWINITDANENVRQETLDALGRMTCVIEPNGTSNVPSMITKYSYDALGNLTNVSQTGQSGDTARTRTFSYNNLSQLTLATNPETGTVSYAYDANGNVLSKISPLVNAPSGTQTIGYNYDSLNRLCYKVYGTSGVDLQSCPIQAPANVIATYNYDTSSVSGAQNTIGRLTDEKSYAGNTLVSERQPYSYDVMGRLLNENQLTFKTASSTSTYSLAYRYDLAGNLIASTDGSKPVPSPSTQFPCTPPSDVQNWTTLAFVNCYDTAGRTSSVTSNWASYPTNLFTAGSTNGYYPAGQLWNWTQGTTSSSTPALSVTQTYTNRLWLNGITATGQVP